MCAGVGEKEEERDCYRCSAGITHHCGGGCMVARPRRRRDQIAVQGITKASEYKHRNELSMQKNMSARETEFFFHLKDCAIPHERRATACRSHTQLHTRGDATKAWKRKGEQVATFRGTLEHQSWNSRHIETKQYISCFTGFYPLSFIL